jgi:peptidoglycan/xylan/chitin deacetylase (PgdA/CDA1 family)
MESRTVFLMYHELELPGRELCQTEPGYVRYIVSEGDFRSHLESLKSRSWQAWSVGQALRSPAQPGCVITFDDGCETDLVAAAPLLSEYGFGATFYITTGYVGRRGYLTVQQLRELLGLGFEIGCHSMTHPYLSDLDADSLRRETAEAKAQLEQWIGARVEHFSCPGGRYSRRVQDAVREAGFMSMATSKNSGNDKQTDRFALGRVAMLRGTGSAEFARLSSGRGLWRLNAEDGLRQAAKRVLGNAAYDRVRSAVLGHDKHA